MRKAKLEDARSVDGDSGRAQTQADFREGKFQVLVSTDAGNEGIDRGSGSGRVCSLMA